MLYIVCDGRGVGETELKGRKEERKESVCNRLIYFNKCQMQCLFAVGTQSHATFICSRTSTIPAEHFDF